MFNHFYKNMVPHTPDGELSSSLETFSQVKYYALIVVNEIINSN